MAWSVAGATPHELQARIVRLEAALRELLKGARQYEAQTLPDVDDAMWRARQIIEAPPSENT